MQPLDYPMTGDTVVLESIEMAILLIITIARKQMEEILF